jgi:hypothetical protein
MLQLAPDGGEHIAFLAFLAWWKGGEAEIKTTIDK